VDELMRATIQEALEVREPAGLRSRVIASVPMERRREATRVPMPRLQWATAFAAILLTAALIAGLVYSRIGALPATKHQHAPAIRLSMPSGIAVGSDGTIYVADNQSNRVFRVQSDGTLATVAGGGSLYDGVATKANLFGPVGLAAAPDGSLFIADNPGARVSRLDPSGNLSTFLSWHSAGSVNEPSGVAVSASGVVYVSVGGGITAIQPDGSTTRIELSGMGGPAPSPGYLALDRTGNLYVADLAPLAGSQDQAPPALGGCRIIRIAPDRSVSVIAGNGKCGYSGDGGLAVNAELDDPKGIAFDANGNLYFADSHNYRIRRIDPRGVITTVAGKGNAGSAGSTGPALGMGLPFVEGLAMVQGRYLYFSERNTNYGAVAVLDLQNGTIRGVVNSYSRVVS
jgi:sugar lactone lactonase YvrE